MLEIIAKIIGILSFLFIFVRYVCVAIYNVLRITCFGRLEILPRTYRLYDTFVYPIFLLKLEQGYHIQIGSHSMSKEKWDALFKHPDTFIIGGTSKLKRWFMYQDYKRFLKLVDKYEKNVQKNKIRNWTGN